MSDSSPSPRPGAEVGELTVADFDYVLPPELIAQTPIPKRDEARLLVVDRGAGALMDSTVNELNRWLDPGDLLIANNSQVIPARLQGRRAETGGRVELLLLKQVAPGRWEALAKPAKRLRPGGIVELSPRDAGTGALAVTIVERRDEGIVVVALPDAVEANLARFGTLPLPPYIHSRLENDERYQTVYARHPGSAAAPTAGLHFTPELISSLREDGIGWAEVTLHVGLDTFRPVTVERVVDHAMHSEVYRVDADVLRRVQAAKVAGRRVVAVGTTSARTLESVGQRWDWRADEPRGCEGPTSIFIVPGYRWRLVDAMVTNFHLPRSTLLMMVSSLAGKMLIEQAYAHAIRERYRFFSFGDAMLIR